MNDFLDGLFGASLDGYMELTELNSQLATKSKFVMNLAESLRLFALNALLASTRLGSDGIVLGAVAGIMRGPTDSIRGRSASSPARSTAPPRSCVRSAFECRSPSSSHKW